MVSFTTVHEDLKLWIHLPSALGFGFFFLRWGDSLVYGEMMFPHLTSSGNTVGTGWCWLWLRRTRIPATEICYVLRHHRKKQLEEGDSVLPWPLYVRRQQVCAEGFPSCRCPLNKSSHNKVSRPSFSPGAGNQEISWSPRSQQWGRNSTDVNRVLLVRKENSRWELKVEEYKLGSPQLRQAVLAHFTS